MEQLLQQATVSYASAEAAQKLAKVAYHQAAQLSQLGAPIVGIGCTCALMTDRIKKGDHKVNKASNKCTALSAEGQMIAPLTVVRSVTQCLCCQ